jgi:spermidine/putrescine transport system permease protein
MISSANKATSDPTLPERQERVRRFWGLFPALAIIGVFMVIPMGIVAVYSFLRANSYGGVFPEFSIAAYRQFFFELDLDDSLLFNPAYLYIFGRSILLALVSTVLCMLISFPVAYYMARQPESRKNILVMLVTIPFWTNLLIRTYCWILILRDNGVINNTLMGLGILNEPIPMLYTNFAILVGLVYTFLPFMILPMYSTLEKLDVKLFEAAHDLYATRWQLLRRIVIPLAMPGIVAGFVLVFIPALGAFVAPDLLGGGKNLMIGSLIQLQFSSSRNWPFGAAASLILLALVLISLMIYARTPAAKAGRGLF